MLDYRKQREQLMEDIDSIIEEFFYETYEGDNVDERDRLITTLCDAVCKHFPAS